MPATPTLNGEELPPCPLYDSVLDQGVVPITEIDPSWCRERIFPSLADLAPEIAEEIWEAIVAIWRLRLNEDVGRGDELWTKHLCAWLVSLSVCL